MTVKVPDDFKRIGFSGLFHLECSFDTDEDRENYRVKAPCFLRGDKWIIIEVTSEGFGVLVRRDNCAIMDLVTKRPSL